MAHAGPDQIEQYRKKDIAKFWTVTGERLRYSSELPRENKSEYQELFLDILSRGLFQPASIDGFEACVSRLFIDRTGDPLLWEHFEERKERQEEINRRNAELRERRYADVVRDGCVRRRNDTV